MAHEFTPQTGYGPFRFGMKPDEVHALLGQPEEVSSVLDFLDPKFVDKEDLPFLKGHFGEDYPGGDKDNGKPSMSYDPTGLVEIRLRNKSDSLIFRGIDLFSADRKKVIADMAALERQVYEGREAFFFPESGICLTKPKFWKTQGSVDFVKSAYIMKRLEYDDWIPADIEKLRRG